MIAKLIPGTPAASKAEDKLVWTFEDRLFVASVTMLITSPLWVHPVAETIGVPSEITGDVELNSAAAVAVLGIPGSELVAWRPGRGIFVYRYDRSTNSIGNKFWLGATNMTAFGSIQFFTAVESSMVAVTSSGQVWRGTINADRRDSTFATLSGSVSTQNVKACFGLPGGICLVKTDGTLLFHELSSDVKPARTLGSVDVEARFYFALQGRPASLRPSGELTIYEAQIEQGPELTLTDTQYYNLHMGTFPVEVAEFQYGVNARFNLSNLDVADGARQFRFVDTKNVPFDLTPVGGPVKGGLPAGTVITCRETGKFIAASESSDLSTGLKPYVFTVERVGPRRFRFRSEGRYLRAAAISPNALLHWHSGAPDSLTEFDVRPATVYRGPETQGAQIRFESDNAEKFIRNLLCDLTAELVGYKLPGGSTLCKTVFGAIFGEDDMASQIEKLLRSFREDILKEVRVLIDQSVNNNNTRLVYSAFSSARTVYEADYMNTEKELLRKSPAGAPDWARRYERAVSAMWAAIREFRQTVFIVEPDELSASISPQLASNLELLRQGFPLYVMAVSGYINALQEMALLLAYHPTDSYVEFIDQLQLRASLLLAKIQKMFDALIQDRVQRLTVEALVGTPNVNPGLDNFAFYRGAVKDPLINKAGFSIALSNQDFQNPLALQGHPVLELYKAVHRFNVQFAFQNCLYRYYDAAQNLKSIGSKTRTLCDSLRANQDDARASFFRTISTTTASLAEILTRLGLQHGAVVEIVDSSTSRLLSVAEPPELFEVPVTLSPANQTHSQRFILSVSGDSIQLRSVRSRALLTVAADGRTVTQRRAQAGSSGQLYTLRAIDATTCTISQTGGANILTLPLGSADGTPVIMASPGSGNQRFTLRPARNSAQQLVADPIAALSGRVVRLRNKRSGQQLEIVAMSTANLAVAIQAEANSNQNQLFTLQYAANRDLYALVAKHSGKALTILDASTAENARLIQYEVNGYDNQLFYILPEPDGSYVVRSELSNRYVCVPDGNLQAGTIIVLRGLGGSPDDSFRWQLIDATSNAPI